MKKNNKFLAMALMASTLFSMTSCAHEVEVTAGAFDSYCRNSTYGDTVAKIDVKVNNGKFTYLSIEETYTPNVWARLADKATAESLGEGNYVRIDTTDFGGSDIVYYAKYIEIDGRTWIGTARTSEDVCDPTDHYEYIKYVASDAADSDSSTDLLSHVQAKDVAVYDLKTYAVNYFDAVTNDKIKILKNTGSDGSASYSEAENVKPTFPDGKKLKSENKTFSAWKTSVDALCKFFVGKNINYSMNVKDKDDKNHQTIKLDGGKYYYNTTMSNERPTTTNDYSKYDNTWDEITDCTAPGIKSYLELNVYLEAINQAFASCEYESIA